MSDARCQTQHVQQQGCPLEPGEGPSGRRMPAQMAEMAAHTGFDPYAETEAQQHVASALGTQPP
jgi:hypothetical protein